MTGETAQLDGFDFIRITNGVNYLAGILGEISTEIDAVSDVAEGSFGDADGDGDWICMTTASLNSAMAVLG